MKKYLIKFKEFIGYSIFGCITTGINLLLFFILEKVGIYYIWANTIAYLFAVIINFYLNKKYVFKKEDRSVIRIRELVKFLIVRTMSLIVDNSLFFLLVTILELNVYVSRIGLSIGIILVTYGINKIWVFNK